MIYFQILKVTEMKNFMPKNYPLNEQNLASMTKLHLSRPISQE